MSNIIRSTTGLALHMVKPYIRSGATVIDATCGNGHDTLALAKAIAQASHNQNSSLRNGQDGSLCGSRLLAFDIQREAIISTGQLLDRNGFSFTNISGNDSTADIHAIRDVSQCCPEITLIHDSHENIDMYADSADAVIFNLGYLPGGNKKITTEAGSTLSAISTALDLLNKDGVLCITMYSGHEAGADEKKTLLNFAGKLDSSRFHVAYINMLNQNNNPPEILVITKKTTI